MIDHAFTPAANPRMDGTCVRCGRPEGAHPDDCSHCEELRVVGPDHRNTIGAEHDEGCTVAP